MKKVPIKCLAILAAIFPSLAHAGAVISELDLANSQVEIVNDGETMVDLTGYRWCNRVNGSPSFYPSLNAATINAGLSTDTDFELQPGEVLTFDLPASFLPAAGGELGLYLPSGSFGSRSAIVDYVNWGTSTGIRDTAAAGAPAIWVLDSAIDISGLGAGDTIQLNLGAPGDSVGDYSVAAATAGVAQSLPPVVAEIDVTDFGFVSPGVIFVEFDYTGSGTVKAVETTDLAEFTDVSARTAVSSPAANRLEFAIPAGTRFFFRLEEE